MGAERIVVRTSTVAGRARSAISALLLLAASPAVQAAAESVPRRPATAALAQFGIAEGGTQAYALGLSHDWDWSAHALAGTFRGYSELLVGRWQASSSGGHAGWVTQVGLSPVLRWSAGSWQRPYLEAGIGADAIVPRYASGSRRFTTRFNFADHVAIGARLGARGGQDVSLRIEHFSNAGIRRPNPGEEFVELRYGWRF